jgi:xylanolytic transcriptional activator XlnR
MIETDVGNQSSHGLNPNERIFFAHSEETEETGEAVQVVQARKERDSNLSEEGRVYAQPTARRSGRTQGGGSQRGHTTVPANHTVPASYSPGNTLSSSTTPTSSGVTDVPADWAIETFSSPPTTTSVPSSALSGARQYRVNSDSRGRQKRSDLILPPGLAGEDSRLTISVDTAIDPQCLDRCEDISSPQDDVGCRYKCLEPVLPLLQGIIDTEDACCLLELYFADPDGSLFKGPSPYVLTPVLRKKSLLHPTNPRETTSALLVTIVWVSAQTATLPTLLRPGRRPTICEKLRKLAIHLINDRDNEDTLRPTKSSSHQNHGKRNPTSRRPIDSTSSHECPRRSTSCCRIDDLLTLVLITIVISGGDLKAECLPWWNRSIRLAEKSALNLTDGSIAEGSQVERIQCDQPGCTCRKIYAHEPYSLAWVEAREEKRRMFWVMFALDRHLALSFNHNILIPDHGCQVFIPLPDDLWENLESISLEQLAQHEYGPPTLVTGVGFFQYFLPLMTILGDIVQMHHRRLHPRFGTLDNQDSVTLIEDLLMNCSQSIQDLSTLGNCQECVAATPHTCTTTLNPFHARRIQLVSLYARFILHVLHVLLHGRWDPVCMLSPDQPSSPLENPDNMNIRNWMTSISFLKCASNGIAASEVVSEILSADPELSFIPYLFGIYLLHGSFILLLFAHRMPDVGGGPNESVEKACETIIRAHEVCVVTLSTEFQRNFRRVLRATLLSVRNQNGRARTYSVGSHGAHDTEPNETGSHSECNGFSSRTGDSVAALHDMDMIHKVLSLYRWSSGGNGLAV